jgi:hypothetical protein
MHVGDDVYILAQTYEEAYQLLRNCKNGGLAMNPMKQSVGEYTVEFLRVAYRKDHCCGYLMRSVGSAVAGNWANELKLDYDEGLRTILNHAWTLGNRSNRTDIALLFKSSMKRMARITGRVAENLLIAKWALPGQACRYYDQDVYDVFIGKHKNKWIDKLDREVKYLDNSATTDYLTFHTTPTEAYALQYMDTSVQNEMKRASYGKTMALRVKFTEDIVEDVDIHVRRRNIIGSETVKDLWDCDERYGVLSGFPILQLVKNRMSEQLTSDLVHSLTGDWHVGIDLIDVAWGDHVRGCAIRGRMTFADAGRVAGRSFMYLVDNYYNCFA